MLFRSNSEKAKEGKEVKFDSKGTEAENSNLAFEEEWTDSTLKMRDDPIAHAVGTVKGGALERTVEAALEGGKEENTIFLQVSKRYRAFWLRLGR